MRLGIVSAVLVSAIAVGVLGCTGEHELELAVGCETYEGPRGVYAVSAGSEFHVRFTRGRNLDRVAARVDWVDAPGFELSTDPKLEEYLWVRAPDEPGLYTWTLENGETEDFLVYDPNEVEPTLAERRAAGGKGRTAMIGLRVGEHRVCVHDRHEAAVVTLAGEGCRSVLAGFEAVPPFRVDVGDGAFELELFSEGRCEVAVELGNGKRTTLSYEPAEPPEAKIEPAERMITETGARIELPLGPEEACSSAPIDGDCDFPYYDDGDCYWDADWGIRHRDPTKPEANPIASDAPVGAGLTTRLDVSMNAFGIVLGPPKDLMFENAKSEVGVHSEGCDGSFQVVAVAPYIAGSHSIVFRSASTSDVGRTTITARPVAETRFAFETKTGALEPGTQEVEVFVRTEASVTASYFDADGKRLYGTAAISVTTDDPEAMSGVTDPDTLITGITPHTLVLRSGGGPHTLTVHVRDESAVAGIDDIVEPTVPVGEEYCVETVTALGASGAPIHGRPPRGPSVSVGGESLVFTRQASLNGVCLRGLAPGESTLSWSWGTATTETRWVITS